MTHIIAHRGNSSAAPENTLAAFREAVEMGADGVEFDVRLSSDGVPVVIHDETLERTTPGAGKVALHTGQELTALDAGGWFSPQFRGETLPPLSRVLELLASTPLIVHIELKTIPDPGLVEAVARLVENAGVGRQAVISSFNPNTLQELQSRGFQSRELQSKATGLASALLLDKAVDIPWEAALELGCAGIHPNHRWVDGTLVERCHGEGLAVRPYTVDDPQRALQLLEWGVDGIITNVPRRLMALREERGG
jgi:glycerophosphoryl diester phosphodiesterase